MSEQQEPKSLEELCDRIEEAESEGDRVKLGAIVEMVGRRSFGPLLLLAGMMASLPFVSDIPGVTTMTGALVLLIAIQLLIGRRYFWLPKWMLERSLAQDKLCKGLSWARPAARFIDRLTGTRLRGLTRGAAQYAIAIFCTAIALVMPAMEVVPFGGMVAGAALIMFGLSMIARDGMLTLVAYAFTALALGLAGYGLLG